MKTYWVIGGAVVSAALLILLLALQAANANILELETRWLALASLPVVIGLLAGGVIKRFSGFGIELEASLEAPVDRIMVAAEAAAMDLPSGDKRSMSHLRAIPEQRRRETRRLSFTLGRTNYYTTPAISRYLEALPQLEFIEIRRTDGTFDSLLPVTALRPHRDRQNEDVIDNFVSSLKRNELGNTFGPDLITDAVYADEEVVEVLPRVRRSRFGVLPVLDRSRRMIGVITTASIEKEIANAVLRARSS